MLTNHSETIKNQNELNLKKRNNPKSQTRKKRKEMRNLSVRNVAQDQSLMKKSNLKRRGRESHPLPVLRAP
jgi:hypothetical protein